MQIAICLQGTTPVVTLTLADLNDMHPDDIEAEFSTIIVLDTDDRHPVATRYDAAAWADQVRDDAGHFSN